jgi:hypothetical protein
MAANMVLLEKITVGAAGASSVTFSGIPQTGYTDLVIKFSARSNYASIYDHMAIFYNGDTASNYVTRWLYGDGASAASGNQTATNSIQPRFAVPGSSATASTFGNGEMYLPNYTSANYKSQSWDTVTENNATTAYAAMDAGLWSNTAAINSIQINPYFGSWIQYTTFYLYGVAKLGTTPAIVPYATGGDTIMTDGTYWYHTFVSSGTFTPQKSLSCDYLVVAGGGGGEGNNNADSYSGGGGAGGLRSTVTATGGGGSLESPLSLASGTGYTVTIGAGGVGSVNDTSTNGSNSVFSTITSTGGGRGGRFGNGYTGGSGSGAGSSYTNVAHTGGAGTTNQGYAGGNSPATGQDANASSGGGGGAGAVGSNGTNGVGGNGGNGVAVSISGSSVTYAGGGGGASRNTQGTGGSGGGGAGAKGTASVSVATAGTVNTGVGGGGGGRDSTLGYNCTGGNGGSGIVIVRYAV